MVNISVIIPVLNDALGLQETVLSFVSQDYPKDRYEIIIIDNGSTDNTAEVANNLVQTYPGLVRYGIENNIKSSYAARNKGINMSNGDIISFIDADVTVLPDYLKNIWTVFEKNSVDYVGVEVILYLKKDTLSSKYNIVNDFPIQTFLEKHHFIPTCCLSIRRPVLDVVGNFDSRLESSGDLEFGTRVYEAGLKQLFVKDIKIRHPARYKYNSLINKSNRIARGIAQLNIYYPGKYTEIYKSYYKIKSYLPAKPIKLYKYYKMKKVRVNFISAIILSFFNTHLGILSFLSLRKEMKRLRKTR